MFKGFKINFVTLTERYCPRFPKWALCVQETLKSGKAKQNRRRERDRDTLDLSFHPLLDSKREEDQEAKNMVNL